jgi:hypothetical protein
MWIDPSRLSASHLPNVIPCNVFSHSQSRMAHNRPASKRRSSRSSLSVRAHREYRKLRNPQSLFLLEHGNPAGGSNLDEAAWQASLCFWTDGKMRPFENWSVQTILRL